MPIPKHGNKGRRQWYTQRNVKRELKRRTDANALAFLADYKAGQAKGKK
tara:strand:+ start:462 stop:608 length:147 start_codon:yes stop_codon:yes gene_type:complete